MISHTIAPFVFQSICIIIIIINIIFIIIIIVIIMQVFNHTPLLTVFFDSSCYGHVYLGSPSDM